jgi:hypothetical protein
VCLGAGAVEPERIDLGVLHRIKSEAFGSNSRVMDTLFYLTDVYGPRLTGSPNIHGAADWSVQKMKEWASPTSSRKPGVHSAGAGRPSGLPR